MRDIELDTLLGHAHLHVMYWDSKEAPHKISKSFAKAVSHQSPASGGISQMGKMVSKYHICPNYLLDNI